MHAPTSWAFFPLLEVALATLAFGFLVRCSTVPYTKGGSVPLGRSTEDVTIDQ